MKLADAVEVCHEQLGRDISLDVAEGCDVLLPAQGCAKSGTPSFSRKFPLQNEMESLAGRHLALEEDVPQNGYQSSLGEFRDSPVAASGAEPGLVPSEEERVSRLFPNSFKVTGIKHVCDNLLSSILHTLPQHFDL